MQRQSLLLTAVLPNAKLYQNPPEQDQLWIISQFRTGPKFVPNPNWKYKIRPHTDSNENSKPPDRALPPEPPKTSVCQVYVKNFQLRPKLYDLLCSRQTRVSSLPGWRAQGKATTALTLACPLHRVVTPVSWRAYMMIAICFIFICISPSFDLLHTCVLLVTYFIIIPVFCLVVTTDLTL